MTDVFVEVKQGKLRGKVAVDYKGGQYFSFQGIPYAKPPVGKLRFKGPVSPDNWDGIRDATKEANGCLSRNFFDRNQIVGSEDCLYLNVFTKELSDAKDLKPVLFWIHGGGFTMGSGKSDVYGPNYLVTGDVVVVTINYRLGLLGYLSFDDPNLGAPGNAGIIDMIQALKWVQENIKKFGGDSKNVTIAGQSAGGAAVHLLVLSPLAKGLFHRAILQSGCALNPWVFGSSSSQKVAKILGFESRNEKDILEFLQTVPAEKLIEALDALLDSLECDKKRPVGLVVEKHSSSPTAILEHPLDIISSGNYNKVPMMIGYTDREGIITEGSHKRKFGALQVPDDFETKIPFFYNLQKGTDLSKTVAKEIKEFYFGSSEPSMENVDEFLKLETDTLFWRGIYVSVLNHVKNLGLPIFLYRFTLDSKLNLKKVIKIDRPGAAHLDELGYLFKNEFVPESQIDGEGRSHIEKMVKIWTNFARNGNPNLDMKNQKWKPVEEGCLHYMNIDKELTFGTDPDVDRMKFWDKISAHQQINSKF